VGIVEFPTRYGLNSQMANDNVFIDSSTFGKYELYPSVNGLSDHDAQLLILVNGKKRKRTVNPLSKEKSISLPQQISYGI
jgi:hypothetical protein